MGTTTLVSKDAVLKSINDLPEQISMDELFNRIIYLFKVETGLAQSKRGEGTPIEEIREKVKAWRLEK
jgi:hypothetical protein